MKTLPVESEEEVPVTSLYEVNDSVLEMPVTTPTDSTNFNDNTESTPDGISLNELQESEPLNKNTNTGSLVENDTEVYVEEEIIDTPTPEKIVTSPNNVYSLFSLLTKPHSTDYPARYLCWGIP